MDEDSSSIEDYHCSVSCDPVAREVRREHRGSAHSDPFGESPGTREPANRVANGFDIN